MSKAIYLNLPVKDLAAATRFYEAIGCKKNARFSDEKASSMAWSEAIHFQLLATDYFASFSPKPIGDAHQSAQMLIALPLESREEVDRLAKAAGTAGGKADPRPVMDQGWMYNRAFEDTEGNIIEVLWMDMSAMPTNA
jgi:predicted lactoylglutathione lyase